MSSSMNIYMRDGFSLSLFRVFSSKSSLFCCWGPHLGPCMCKASTIHLKLFHEDTPQVWSSSLSTSSEDMKTPLWVVHGWQQLIAWSLHTAACSWYWTGVSREELYNIQWNPNILQSLGKDCGKERAFVTHVAVVVCDCEHVKRTRKNLQEVLINKTTVWKQPSPAAWTVKALAVGLWVPGDTA